MVANGETEQSAAAAAAAAVRPQQQIQWEYSSSVLSTAKQATTTTAATITSTNTIHPKILERETPGATNVERLLTKYAATEPNYGKASIPADADALPDDKQHRNPVGGIEQQTPEKHRHLSPAPDVVVVTRTPKRGELDDFFNYADTTVRGVTIQAVMMPSPDKSASTVSWSASPDFVAEFPEAKSSGSSLPKFQQRPLQLPQPADPDIPSKSKSSLGENEHCLPLEKQHRLTPMETGAAAEVRNDHSFHKPSRTTFSNRDHLLKIQIETSNHHQYHQHQQQHVRTDNDTNINRHSFYVSLSLMLQREIEMQEAARINRIGQDRWSTSRIFRMWKKQRSKQNHDAEHIADNNGEMTIIMTPEVTLQNASCSSSTFRWKPWLTSCIRAYYNTGSLRIPKSCQGDDILLALEYFGILTARPDMFVFESSKAFERIQSWSRYFTFRTELAETLLEAFDAIADDDDYNDVEEEGDEDQEIDHDQARALFLRTSSKVRLWVLMDEGMGGFPTVVTSKENNGHVDVLLQVGGVVAKPLTVRAQGGLYELFCGQESEVGGPKNREDGDEDELLTRQLSERLRLDFCNYVRQSLPPRTRVTFKMERVASIPLPKLAGMYSSSLGTEFEMKPVICVEPECGNAPTTYQKVGHEPLALTMMEVNDDATNIVVQEETVKLQTLSLDNDPNSCMSRYSVGSGTKHEHVVATSRASTTVSHIRSKMSTDDFECSTYPSPQTKTLAGEGISTSIGTTSSNPSPLFKKALFLEEQAPKQQCLQDNKIASGMELGFHIEPRRVYEDPTCTSPRSMQVQDQYTRLTHTVDATRVQKEDVKVRTQKLDNDSAPVRYINTEFGDLRSVTSMLSEPVIDSPGFVCALQATNPVLFSSVRISDDAGLSRESEKRMITETAKTIIQKRRLDESAATELSATGRFDNDATHEPDRNVSAPLTEWINDVNVIKELSSERGTKNESVDAEEKLNSKSDPNVPVLHGASKVTKGASGTEPFGSWEQILASVCEAVIPAAPSNDTTSSPTRTFTVTAHNDQPLAATTALRNDLPFADCPCRQFQGDTAERVPNVSVPNGNNTVDNKGVSNATENGSSNPDEFLDRARQLGRDLSSQFDALMKMAYDGGDAIHSMSRALAPVPEEFPVTLPPLTIDEKSLTNISLRSSGLQRNSKKPVETTSKKHRQTSVDPYSIPKSQSFDSDPLVESSVPLPPHQSRRSRNKMAVARKKPSAKNPPNPPPTDSVDRGTSIVDIPSIAKKTYSATRDPSVSSLSDVSVGRIPRKQCRGEDERKMLT